MARKLGVYMSKPLEALIQGRDGLDESLSGRLSTVAERYALIVEKHKPDMSEAEWNACRDALNGVWLRDALSLSAIWAEIYDADALNGLGAKWGIDAKALAHRVRDMNAAEKVALVEAVENWWSDQ